MEMFDLKKLVIYFICTLLIFNLCGCNKSEKNDYVRNDVDETSVVSTTYSEREQLESLLELVLPITDYSLYGLLNDFFGKAISTVLSSSPNSTASELESMMQSVLEITEPIINAEVPTGYYLEAKWSNLVGDCTLTNHYMQTTIDAVIDNDSATVLQTKNLSGNMGTVEKAYEIQNVLTKEISDFEVQESKEAIEIKADYYECEKKALRYARYYLENSNINEVSGSKEAVTFDDIPGKHYVFTVPTVDDFWVLISVEDKSIIGRQKTPEGYRYHYMSDGQLPAEVGDLSMPDVIGMEKDEAVSLIESMGLEVEVGIMDLNNVESGLVCNCYPQPGNLLTEDTIVHLHIEK